MPETTRRRETDENGNVWELTNCGWRQINANQTTAAKRLTFTLDELKQIILGYWFSEPPSSLTEATEKIDMQLQEQWFRKGCDHGENTTTIFDDSRLSTHQMVEVLRRQGYAETAARLAACAREAERLRGREAYLLSVIRHYNPDDALFDHEKGLPND